MEAWRILRHSALQIILQPVDVLRIFFLPLAAQFLLLKLTGLSYVLSPFYLQIAINRGIVPWGKMALVLLVSALLAAWAAAAWHRFILMGERPTRPWPSVPMRTFGQFLLQGLWVALLGFAVIVLASLVAGFILGFAGAFTGRPPGWIAGGVSLLVTLPILAVALRLAVNLPRAAIGAPGTMASVWAATAGKLPTYIALMVALTALRLGSAQLLFLLGLTAMSDLGFLAVALVETVLLLLTLSIVTTVYGHHVDDRPLV
jgi:hypothetical protein